MIFLSKKRKNKTFGEANVSKLPYFAQNKLRPSENITKRRIDISIQNEFRKVMNEFLLQIIKKIKAIFIYSYINCYIYATI